MTPETTTPDPINNVFTSLGATVLTCDGWTRLQAMEVPGGCIVLRTAVASRQLAESMTFVPGVSIVPTSNGAHKLAPTVASDSPPTPEEAPATDLAEAMRREMAQLEQVGSGECHNLGFSPPPQSADSPSDLIEEISNNPALKIEFDKDHARRLNEFLLEEKQKAAKDLAYQNRIISKAREFAAGVHGGMPVMEELEKLAARVGDHWEHKALAWLSYLPRGKAYALEDAGIPERISKAAQILTREPSEEYHEYIAGVRRNKLATHVKIQTLISAIPFSRDDIQIRKWSRALEYLTNPAYTTYGS